MLDTDKIRRWLAGHWRDVLAVAGVVIGLLGVVYGYLANRPKNDLRYSVLRQFEVFDAEENRGLPVLVKNRDTNSARAKKGNTRKAAGGSHIVYKDCTWDVCEDSLDAFEIEIINSGINNIGYKDRPDDANAICIKTEPAVRIVDARVVKGDSNDNEFELIEDERWGKGEVECRWRVLRSGESVVARVVHTRPEERLAICLAGEIFEYLKPKRMKPPKTRTVAEQIHYRKKMSWIIVVAIGVWFVLFIQALYRRRRDKRLLRDSNMPKIILPGMLKYLRREALLQLWFLVLVLGLMFYVMLFL